MKKIAVIGLGIIGGSICGALTNAGYQVDGFGRSASSISFALQAGYIRAKGENLCDYDVVFIAVPPKATIDYLENASFKDGALVADICGVKKVIEERVYAKPRNYRYVGLHPMAGKETSGIASASPELFVNANLIITHATQTREEDVAEIKEYAKAMRFGKIIECSAEEHDKKIALTSQLAHIVSNAYVKSPQVKGCDGFTGGSFQDMTRIAGVDESVWTPLYAYNRENITQELTLLIEHLNVYRDALLQGDDEKLSQTLKEGRLIRENIKRGND
ncbi:MAG: prephenate dehydrogenase/arogenate dehydrogenase family protein [Clostridiales bacterium]|nr:prephenate dehydrogenase/arogenate dehydrogenase family protein [Clostridiales bacterium]